MQRRPHTKCPDLLMCAEPTCDNHASYLHIIEKHVLRVLQQWSTGYLINGDLSELIPSPDQLKPELDTVVKARASVKSQLDRAFDAFETGIYDAETFRQRSAVLKKRLAEIDNKTAELKNQITHIEEKKKIISEFIPGIRSLLEVYETSEPAEKNKMLSAIIDHIDYIKEVCGHGHEEDFHITVYPRLPKL